MVDADVAGSVPGGGEWVVTALLDGVRARVRGDIAVSGSLKDVAMWQSQGAVLRMSSDDPEDRLLGAAAAASAVLWVCVTPDTGVRGRLRLDHGAAYRDVAVGLVVVSDEPVDVGRLRLMAGVQHVRAAPSTPSRKALRVLRRVGRWVGAAAVSPDRFDLADRPVRQASAVSSANAAISDLLESEDVEEFQIRGSESMTVTYARMGEEELRASPFRSDEELIEAARFVAAYGRSPQPFDRRNPRLDVKVGERWRLHAEAWSVSPPSMVLRANLGGRLSLAEMAFADQRLTRVLVEAIAGRVRANMVIGAPMFGGKTTLAQGLLGKVPGKERIDTIEDTAELGLATFGIHPNTYERMTREANNDGEGALTMADHIRDAKRAKTGKLVIGETRGEGTLALLDAMSSGLHGCLVTLHSGPGRAMVEKLVSYASLEGAEPGWARAQVSLAVRLLVWLDRNEAGERVVGDVTEITGFDERTSLIETRRLWALQPGDRWATPACVPDGFAATLYESAGVTVVDEVSAGAHPSGGGRQGIRVLGGNR